MPPASVLSPLAIPFEPSRPGYEEYAPFDAIYNDGVPEGIVVGSHANHEVIHNIPDTAIEEIFPPSAAGKYCNVTSKTLTAGALLFPSNPFNPIACS